MSFRHNLIVITSDNVTGLKGSYTLGFVAKALRKMSLLGNKGSGIKKNLTATVSKVDKTVTLTHPVTHEVLATYKVES